MDAASGATQHHNVKQAVPFFLVSDMERSLKYYVDGLGFEMKNKWVHEGKLRWCWLQLGDAAVMLQQFEIGTAHARAHGAKFGEGVSIYFICEDALRIYQEVVARNIPASEPFVGNHMWVTGLSDPDGYRIIFESNTDVPEGTKISDRELKNKNKK